MKYLCVFGNPIAHSLSPLIHNFALAKLGLPFMYGRFCLDNGKDLKNTFFRLNLSGANITVPFKEHALSQADELDSLAQEIGAVNTLVLESSGKLKGYNTDASGFVESIRDFMPNPDFAPRTAKSALVLGAGGSAKAVACILTKYGLEVQVANRSDSKRDFYASRGIEYRLFSELEARDFDIVINATSASLQGELPLPKNLLSEIFIHSKLAYDLMYGKNLTPFLALAKDCHIDYKDGKDMLLWQAAKALVLFISTENTSNLYQEHQIYALMSQAINSHKA